MRAGSGQGSDVGWRALLAVSGHPNPSVASLPGEGCRDPAGGEAWPASSLPLPQKDPATIYIPHTPPLRFQLLWDSILSLLYFSFSFAISKKPELPDGWGR